MTTDRERIDFLMTLTPEEQVEFLRIYGFEFEVPQPA